MGNKKDVGIVRELAKVVKEIGQSERQKKLREMWKNHNSLQASGIPVHVWLSMCPDEVVREEDLACETDIYRKIEKELRLTIFQDMIKDDTIIEPFFTLRAKHIPDLGHRYGIPMITGSERDTRKYSFTPPVQSVEDIGKLVMPDHKIDWDATNNEADVLRDAFGDIMPVVIDSAPMFVAIEGDISTDLGFLLGFENLLYYVYDDPELLHELAKTLSNAILRQHEQAEEAGDWKSVSGQNQCITYSNELPDPDSSGAGVAQKSLWGFMASQEFTECSPKTFQEFLLPYQIPILERFGLAAYGCCENLTEKISIIKQVKNMRRISVSPWAKLPACAEIIGKEYVLSWRPNPAEMIAETQDEDHIRQVVKEANEIFKRYGNVADITLKDVITTHNNPEKFKKWVEIVRSATG